MSNTPLGANEDSNAPWNQEEKLVNVKVMITQILYTTTTIQVPIDYTREDLKEEILSYYPLPSDNNCDWHEDELIVEEI